MAENLVEQTEAASSSLDINGNLSNLPLKEKHDEINDDAMNKNKRKRLEYLLKQTEVFSHFMSPDGNESKKNRKKSEKTNNRRNRKKKSEEDDFDGNVSGEAPDAYSFQETPHYIDGEMRDYQIRGLNWLILLYENNINGILADEMGLGKTLQTISIIGYLYHFKELHRPYLIVVPKSTLYNWIDEFKRWCPSVKTFPYFGSKEEREGLRHELLSKNKWDVCITTYQVALSDQSYLRRIKWQYFVIDEGHRIKNENTLLAKAVRKFYSRNRLLLTGTPLQNNLHELWALLNFLLPDVFDSSEDFDEWFDSDECLGNENLVQRLQKVLKPFMLRRVKADVEKSLLPKKETKIYISMTPMQREWYKNLLLKDVDVLIGGCQSGKMRLQNMLMHLRKCANHPYLFQGAEPEPFVCGDHLVTNSGKMIVLDKLLAKLKAQGSRILLFSQMSRMLDIFEDYCFLRNYEYCRLDGNSSFEDRAQAIEDFNAENSSKFIFMLTTRAGGLGLNLMTADIVIIYDSDWNPQADLQAMDRAHRIGQKKQVRVFRLGVENTVDQKIIERAEVKLRLDKIVIQHGKTAMNNNQMTKNDMQHIVKFGANAILSSKESEFIDESIDQILERAEKRTALEEVELNKLGENELRAFSLDTPATTLGESIEVFKFEGVNYRQFQKKVQDPFMLELPKRQRKPAKTFTSMHQQLFQMKQPKQPLSKPRVFHDFQFYPKRFLELEEENELYDEDGTKLILLSERDLKVKDELENKGFKNWNITNFNHYINALAHFGRNNIDQISQNVPGKTPEEVVAYHKVFSKRGHELDNYHSIMKRIKRGEDMLKKKDELSDAVAWKMAQYKDPLHELTVRIRRKSEDSKKFNERCDRFIVYELHKNGVNTLNIYQNIQTAMRASPLLLFEYYVKTLTVKEIEKQARVLLDAIYAEYKTMIERKNQPPKPLSNINSTKENSLTESVASSSGVVFPKIVKDMKKLSLPLEKMHVSELENKMNENDNTTISEAKKRSAAELDEDESYTISTDSECSLISLKSNDSTICSDVDETISKSKKFKSK